MFDNSVILEGQSQKSFAVSIVAAQSVQLDPGTYDVWANVDVYIKVAPNASDVTTDTGYLVKTGNITPVRVLAMNSRIGAIAAENGTIRFHKVSQ